MSWSKNSLWSKGLSSFFSVTMDHIWFGHGSWINMWLFKFPFWVKDFSQNTHLNGLYPEWILSCIVRCDCHRKLFPHSIQTYSEEVLWDCLCDLDFFTASAKKKFEFQWICGKKNTLKAPITTAAFSDIFPSFRQKLGILHENRLPADDSHEISCFIC